MGVWDVDRMGATRKSSPKRWVCTSSGNVNVREGGHGKTWGQAKDISWKVVLGDMGLREESNLEQDLEIQTVDFGIDQ